MWPILVEKPNGPWSNCQVAQALGHHIIGKGICACPQVPQGYIAQNQFSFNVAHKLCTRFVQIHYPNIDFLSPLGFGVGQNGFWGWVHRRGGLITHQPTQCTYLHRSPIHLPKPLLYLLRLSTFPPSNSLPPPFTPKAKRIKKLLKRN